MILTTSKCMLFTALIVLTSGSYAATYYTIYSDKGVEQRAFIPESHEDTKEIWALPQITLIYLHFSNGQRQVAYLPAPNTSLDRSPSLSQSESSQYSIATVRQLGLYWSIPNIQLLLNIAPTQQLESIGDSDFHVYEVINNNHSTLHSGLVPRTPQAMRSLLTRPSFQVFNIYFRDNTQIYVYVPQTQMRSIDHSLTRTYGPNHNNQVAWRYVGIFYSTAMPSPLPISTYSQGSTAYAVAEENTPNQQIIASPVTNSDELQYSNHLISLPPLDSETPACSQPSHPAYSNIIQAVGFADEDETEEEG